MLILELERRREGMAWLARSATRDELAKWERAEGVSVSRAAIVLSRGFWPRPTVKASFQVRGQLQRVEEHRGRRDGRIHLVSRRHGKATG